MSILAIIGCATALFVATKFITDALLRGGNFTAATLLSVVAGAAAVAFIVMNAPSFWAGVGCYFAAAIISTIVCMAVYAVMPTSEDAYKFA